MFNKRGMLPEDLLDIILMLVLLFAFLVVFSFKDMSNGVVKIETNNIQEGMVMNDANLLLVNYLRSDANSEGLTFSDMIILSIKDPDKKNELSSYSQSYFSNFKSEKTASVILKIRGEKISEYHSDGLAQGKLVISEIKEYIPNGEGNFIEVALEVGEYVE